MSILTPVETYQTIFKRVYDDHMFELIGMDKDHPEYSKLEEQARRAGNKTAIKYTWSSYLFQFKIPKEIIESVSNIKTYIRKDLYHTDGVTKKVIL